MAIEISGRLDNTTLQLLKDIADMTAPLWQIKASIILKYWIKIISCTIQREMARNLIQHTSCINGRLKKPTAASLDQVNREDLIDSFTADNIRFKSLQLRSGTSEIYNDVSYYRQRSRKPTSNVAAIDYSSVDLVVADV